MAGDWIKMRASLCTHPKVLMIADIIGASTEIGRRLSTGFNGSLDEIVTRDVTRDVTLAALLRVWCATNEHTDDGVWHKSTLRTLDHAAGIQGFGAAMAAAGWAVYDEEAGTVTLPNFLENNAPAKNNARSSGAERQARYRLRHKPSDVTRDVTVTVTSDAREEKRREEKKDQKKEQAPRATRFGLDSLPDDWKAFCKRERPDLDAAKTFDGFADFWRAKPGKDGRKLDWLATWRNWVRNERSGINGSHNPSTAAAEALRMLDERERRAQVGT